MDYRPKVLAAEPTPSGGCSVWVQLECDIKAECRMDFEITPDELRTIMANRYRGAIERKLDRVAAREQRNGHF